MADRVNILVVDDEPMQLDIIRDILRDAGHAVAVADGPDAAGDRLKSGTWDLVLTDWRMPGAGGKGVLTAAHELCPDAAVIVMTAYGSIEGAVEAVRLGASDYLSKPFDKSALLLAVTKGLTRRELTVENRRLKGRIRPRALDEIFTGNSRVIRDLKSLVAKACEVTSTVLITGESGVGKELVARAIHDCGPRPRAPFVAINCAAIPGALIESELFGHEKGAFTGADRQVRGRFEQAEDGTLLLDEIRSMPLELQGKLLRALQERSITRVGGEEARPVRARIITATNGDLRAAVRAGEFREDLYFRLHVLPIAVPPLRERREDIPALVATIHAKLAERFEQPPRALTPAALVALQGHRWPGNVRELENVLERLWVTADGPEIGADDVHAALEQPLGTAGTGDGTVAPEDAGAAVEFLRHAGHTIDELEARLLREALARTGGHIAQAARLLGLSYKTMQYRIRKHGICTRPAPAGPGAL